MVSTETVERMAEALRKCVGTLSWYATETGDSDDAELAEEGLAALVAYKAETGDG